MNERKQSYCLPSRNSSSGFLSGLLVGGVIGAAAFFLFGTEKGKKVKEILIEEGKGFLDELEDLQTDLKEEPREEKIIEEPPKIPAETKSGKSKVEKVKKTISQRFFQRNGRRLG